MLSPEKNDIDITKLFNWNDKYTIYGVDGIKNVEVYIRLVGDSDFNIARIKALRNSTALRKKLLTEDSDERIAFIPDKEFVDKEKIIDLVVMMLIPNFRDEIMNNIVIPFPKEPKSDATQEELEKYQEELDNFEGIRFELIKEEIEKLVRKEKKARSKLSFDQLYDEYVDGTISTLCREELNKSFMEYCVYSSVYKDKDFTERYFSNFEQFVNLPHAVKKQFLDAYSELDIGVYDLKK